MVIQIDIHQLFPVFQKTVACIGYFDGLHLGHRQLLEKTLEESSLMHLKPAAICFEPDPLQIITQTVPKHILSFSQRIEKLKEYGIKDVYVFRFDEDLMKMDAKDFICTYLNRMNLSKLICGYDFSYGHMGKGSPVLLKEYGSFETIVIPKYSYEGDKVSATRIKDALFRGDFGLAETLLGYEYYTDVTVGKCSKKGSKRLIEAMPLDPDVIMPNDGVYQGLEIKDNRLYILDNDTHDIGETIRIRYRDYERTV